MNISKIHSNREFHYRDIMRIHEISMVFLCTSSRSQEKRGKVQSDPAEGGLSADAALPEGLEFPSALRLLLQHGAKWTFGAEGIPPLCLYAATREVGNDIFGDEESLMVVNSCTISYNFAVSATVSLPVTPFLWNGRLPEECKADWMEEHGEDSCAGDDWICIGESSEFATCLYKQRYSLSF